MRDVLRIRTNAPLRPADGFSITYGPQTAGSSRVSGETIVQRGTGIVAEIKPSVFSVFEERTAREEASGNQLSLRESEKGYRQCRFWPRMAHPQLIDLVMPDDERPDVRIDLHHAVRDLCKIGFGLRVRLPKYQHEVEAGLLHRLVVTPCMPDKAFFHSLTIDHGTGFRRRRSLRTSHLRPLAGSGLLDLWQYGAPGFHAGQSREDHCR